MNIEVIDTEIEHLKYLKNLCLEEVPEGATLDTIIYKKYLKMESVKNVAKRLNDEGYRIRSPATGEQIKYQSNDITARLKDKKADVRQDLKELVQKMFMKNKKQIRRLG